jgi:SNF2 family DNA or RNA helicase
MYSAQDDHAYRQAVGQGNFQQMRQAAYASVAPLKLARLHEAVDDARANGRKVLVFSYYRSVLARVAGSLRARGGAVFDPITGATTAASRQSLVDEFTSHAAPAVLLGQVDAAGQGLNIQAASVVILCEPSVKPAMEQQAIARARRMGQTETVHVHRLLAADSADQRMLELLGQKQRLFDTFVRDSHLADSSPTASDETTLGSEVVRLERLRLGFDVA